MTLPLPIETYRKYAEEHLRYIGGYGHYRPETDAVYRAVTEGRDRPPFPNSYSSCGDAAHFLLYRLGVRSQWVNRAEHLGWKNSNKENNVTLLQACPGLVRNPQPDTRYQCGDIGIIWTTGTDAHVFCVLEDRQPRSLVVAEYGQPGGHVKDRPVAYNWGLLVIGTRSLRVVLPLEEVLLNAYERGELGTAENVRTWAERMGLPAPDASASDTDPLPPPRETPIAIVLDPKELPVLRLGATGEAVKLLQGRLVSKGWSIRIDGVLGSGTLHALREFQHRMGAGAVDGICGAITWAALLKEGG